MIFDTIENKQNYADFHQLYNVLLYLEQIKTENFPLFSVSIIEDLITANPVTLTTKHKKDCIYEAHKKYIDLHYIIEGVEGIATADACTLSSISPFDYKKDIGFYKGRQDGLYFLKPGQFMVCWPQDAHKVAIMHNSPGIVKKIVVKIKVAES